ncbi:MAG: DNA polymerase ligase N-terminal domain-containing protein [Candidatus Bathyarchaeia archaeon]
MGLEEYWRKRDFMETPEPIGEVKLSEGRIYVVHEHHARHLHYELRLEMDGVLKSWAVPKTPPTEKGVKRLAVQVEDHPIDYAEFEGTIPEGNYGAGIVKVWDRGSYVMKEIEENKIVFQINGQKLKGEYCLIRFKGDKNWLFFKVKD